MKRSMSVAGMFYPDSCGEIAHFIEEWNRILDAAGVQLGGDGKKPRAAIVPHAGYIYSGFTANVAYCALAKRDFSTLVVIGPSHRVGFSGVSVGLFESYLTPCGEIQGNKELAEDLINNGFGRFLPQAHQEHSTEVQFPFIRYYFPDALLVECVYSDADPALLERLVSYLLQDRENGVIISTDLSHYYPLKKAEALDYHCLEAVANLDEIKLDAGCEACGALGLRGVIRAGRAMGLKPQLLDYRTSADASGDRSHVVGYMSGLLI